MAGPPLIEIREWGRPARRLVLSRPIVVGRDCTGAILADERVSRQHLRLVPSPTALSVVDLGSRNGTTVNGVALTRRVALVPGDVVRLGRSEIIVLHTPTVDPGVLELEHDATRLAQVVAAPPPPPPPGRSARSPLLTLAERVLGIDAGGERQPFPSYTELTSKVPLRVWQVLRIASIVGLLVLVAMMFLRPAAGLFVFFQVIVPLLPILFLVAPGLWRNICPLAASNQLPRVLGISRGRTAPNWLRNRGYLIAVTLFVGIAAARLAGLDRSGAAMGIVLGAVLATAIAGGFLFKGKSGWCSSVCPLLPLQRVYGQTPFVTVPNTHCATCVGCAKNCYDFKPRAAYHADLAESDPGWSAPRKLFVAALPGFVLGFFMLTDQADVPTPQKFSLLGVCVLVSIGSFYAVDAMSPLSAAMLTVTYAAGALNIFYWFTGPVVAGALREITGVDAPWLRWPISVTVAALTLLWIARTRVSELQFALTTGARSEPVLLKPPTRRKTAPDEGSAQVRFEPNDTLSPRSREQACWRSPSATTNRSRRAAGWGSAEPTRSPSSTACHACRHRSATNSTRCGGSGWAHRHGWPAARGSGQGRSPSRSHPNRRHPDGATRTRYDRSIVSVVVIGNGIAGVTAADFVRRGHPRLRDPPRRREPHVLYNRMGISRLVYGRSAMQGLYLLPEQWYAEHGVTAWLNTVAPGSTSAHRSVLLGTGEALPYDRLILAMGASAATPTIGGLDRPGSFVLREAGDAMQIRAYAQQHGCRRAVVAGGGLLGLEAAYSLHLLGLRVTVLERGERLLSRHIDATCSEMVAAHFARAESRSCARAESSHVIGRSRGDRRVLKDNRTVPCDIFLAATGIRPNIDLARNAGVPVGTGVLVDDRMQTAGAGGVRRRRRRRAPRPGPRAVAGRDRTGAGRRRQRARRQCADVRDARNDPQGRWPGAVFDRPREGGAIRRGHCGRRRRASYRRLVLSDGRAVGATVLGHHPNDLVAAQKAVRDRIR